jgi:hypothetical protein
MAAESIWRNNRSGGNMNQCHRNGEAARRKPINLSASKEMKAGENNEIMKSLAGAEKRRKRN